MSDNTELKRLAEAANAVAGDVSVDITISSERGPNQDEIDAVTAFVGAATPAAVLALIAENKRLHAMTGTTMGVGSGEGSLFVHGDYDSIKAAQAIVIERDRLRAEVAGLRTGYEAYEQVNAELKAEVEALRDDLEQKHYDANAWRNGEESVWIEVFNSEGDDPFICAISGQITVEQLALIQAEILEYREDYFEKGSGLYVFRCAHYQAHHDNVGMTEPAHWETDFESYSPFPWEEEAAAMANGEQS